MYKSVYGAWRLIKNRVILLLFCLLCSNAYSEVKTIKIAILDNLLDAETRYASTQYAVFYLNGIDLAVKEAVKKGFNIQYKTFFYSQGAPLKILEKIPEVEKWKPDVIVGPRWSDQFLILKDYFEDTMVISPFATAKEVYDMPKNFYSISPPNKFLAKAIVKFQEENFIDKNIFMLIEADCKSCIDLGENIKKEAPGEILIERNYFLDSESENVDIRKITHGYDGKSPIMLLTLGHSAGILMGRISDYLRINNIIFLGGDHWGGWKIWDAGKIKSEYNYQGFRVTSWSTEIKEQSIEKFNELYKSFYKESPDNISYIGYQVINSIIEAEIMYPFQSASTKESILKSYQMAIKCNNQWFRPTDFGVYHLNQQGEHFFETITIN